MIQAREFQMRRRKILSMMAPQSVMILYAGVAKNSSADATHDFEVNRNFHYLTGLRQEESILILVKSDGEEKEFLFIHPYDEKKEAWYGKLYTPEEATAISGIENVLETGTFAGKLEGILNPSIGMFGQIDTVYVDLDLENKIGERHYTYMLPAELEGQYPDVTVEDAYPIITKCRLIKSPREVAELRAAIEITKLGIDQIWANMAPGVKEYEIRTIFERTVNDHNAYHGLAFPTIVASGIHGTVLHYPDSQDTLKNGDLLLTDLGARVNYYCADVTRTVPINGRYTPLQRTVYDIVLGANKMVASNARPGITVSELQRMTVDYLAAECLEKGLIEKKEDIINYYFHNVSHLIGLDTHDPYNRPNTKDYKEIPLEEGMVISDEPGLYMKDKGIGIRIEDDLLITKDGCEVLTAGIKKDPDEIEAFLASRRF